MARHRISHFTLEGANMKAFAICTLVGLMAVGYWVQATALDDAPVADEVKTDLPTAVTDDATSAVDAEIDALRQELLWLTEQAMLEMDAAELRAEVEAARRRVSDSAANAKLEQIRRQLAELIEQYPDTNAAGLAAGMLNVSDGTHLILPSEFNPSSEVNFF